MAAETWLDQSRMERRGTVKEGIHPTYYQDALVVCACGNTWHTGSTKKEIHTDVCYKCHPFYTGEQRIVDTAGQVERFMKRTAAAEQIKTETEARPSKKQRRAQARAEARGIPEPEVIATEAVASGPVETTEAATATDQGAAAPEATAGEERRPNRPPRGPRPEGERRQRPPRPPRPRAEQTAAPQAEANQPAPETDSTPDAGSAPAGEAPAA